MKNILSFMMVVSLIMSGIEVSAVGNYFRSYRRYPINLSEDFSVDKVNGLDILFEKSQQFMFQRVHVQYTADYEVFIDKLPATQDVPMCVINDDQKKINIFVADFDFDLLKRIIASSLVRAQIHSSCNSFTQDLEDAFSQRCWNKNFNVVSAMYYQLVERLIEKKADILSDFLNLRDLLSDEEIIFRLRDVALRRSIGEEVLLSMGLTIKQIREVKLSTLFESKLVS